MKRHKAYRDLLALCAWFSVAKATQEVQMSTQDAVILKQGCGYIQKDVVI